MDNSVYLFAGFSITWSVIFVYVFKLFREQRAFRNQIASIEHTLQKKIELDGGEA